jgi:hypothetical protein
MLLQFAALIDSCFLLSVIALSASISASSHMLLQFATLINSCCLLSMIAKVIPSFVLLTQTWFRQGRGRGRGRGRGM